MNYRSDLQAVRFFAMIFVFYFHKRNIYFKGGFIGVDIFFTLSGYFITGSLLRRLFKDKYYLSFFKGRILRLQPMSNFVLVIIYLTSMHNTFVAYKRSKEILSCLYSYANYYYYYVSVDYLEQSSMLNSLPLLHYWSLSVENQFYFIIPFIIKSIYNKYISYFSFFIFLIAVLFAFFICSKDIKYSYYAFEVRLCELLFGSYLNIVHYENIIKFQHIYDVIIIIMWIFSNYECSTDEYPNRKMIYPLITSFLMLFQEPNNSSLFSIKMFQYFGSLSYSFYIIHYPLLTNYYRISIVIVMIIAIICFYSIENNFVKFNISTVATYTISITILFIITLLQLKSIRNYKKEIIETKKCKIMYTQDKSLLYSCIFYHKLKNEEIINKKYILLLGDSHLRQWNLVLLPIYNINNTKVVFISLHANYFFNHYHLIVNRVLEILGSPYYVFECFCSATNIRNATYIHNYISLNYYLSNLTKKIIIIVDNPYLSFNPNIYYSRKLSYKQLRCNININCTTDDQPRIIKNNIFYINLTSHFCNNNLCHLYKNGLRIYADNNHLTDCFVRAMKKYVYKELKKHKLYCSSSINLPYNQKLISFCNIRDDKLFRKFNNTINNIKYIH